MTCAIWEVRHVARKSAKSKPAQQGTIVVAVKATRAWREWANKLAKTERASLSTLIDQQLARLARERGLPEPPVRLKE
jgi:hypothetical protein